MARIEYVGHATVVVDLDGVRLLTDPLLRNRVAHLRRSAPVPARAQRGVDAVLISHAHYDHLDLPSLEKLGKSLPMVVPRGLGGLLRKRKFESVLEIGVGETLAIGALEIRAVPAEHDRSRGPFGATADPLGYVVSGSKSVYFAGDTDLFDGMRELGPVDVGLIPIWGWGPGLGSGGHLDPERAAEAVALVAAEARDPDPLGNLLPDPPRPARRDRFVGLPAARVRRAPWARPRRRSRCACCSPGETDWSSTKREGGRRRRSADDRLLADLARDVRDVGTERRVRDDVQPGRLLGEVPDLHVHREASARPEPARQLRSQLAEPASSETPSRTGSSTVTSRRGSSTERFTSVVDTIVVFGTNTRRPSSVASAV